MRSLALPARLAHMVAEAGKRGEAQKAAELAVLLTERGLGGNETDLDARIVAIPQRSFRPCAARKRIGKAACRKCPKQGRSGRLERRPDAD
jgi:ATP-dependent helicase HrpB